MTSTEPPHVSVIVPVLNDEDGLRRCLDALMAQSTTHRFEVIVVDNGSRDETVAVATSHPIKPSVRTEHRRGSYAARNAGIQAARAPLLAFTDADCEPGPGWLDQGIAALQEADAAGGRIDTCISDRPASGSSGTRLTT